ncbi:MAG: formimidoylglutamate deiminase [Geminicoccaceae bacterium]
MPTTRTLFFTQALLPEGWADDVRVTLDQGVIAGIETGAVAGPTDERHGVALPGMPNLHSHAFQRGMAGLAERRGASADSFWTWREVMYRFLERMEPDDVEAVAAQLQVEMLETGFTRVGEFHYLHHGIDGTPYTAPAEMAARIAAAAETSGIGLTLLPVFYAHAGFGGQPPNPGQRRFLSDPESFARLMEESRAAVAGLPDAVVGIAPHSLRAVTEAELAGILPLAGGGPVHIHVAEQVAEVEACVGWSGQRPVEWLLGHAPVDGRWCLIHATHMTDDEAAAMARSGAVAGLCPITEANLGDGTFNALPFLAAGGAYGVGSDSNVLIDLGGELRQLEYSQRLHHRARNVLATAAQPATGRALFEAAVLGGARALGVAAGLCHGAAADIVTIDGAHPALVGRSGDALLDSMVFAGGSSTIHSVWRAGRLVVREGRHVARDAVRARFARTMCKLLA